MKIATWNVNGLRARFDFLAHWLASRSPDVVLLQELKLEDEQFPTAELEQLGYRAVAHGQRSWNGVAVLASRMLGRESPEVVCAGLPGQEAAGARLLCARVGRIQVCSVYCPNGKHVGHADFPVKLAWYDALFRFLREHHRPDQPLVLGGDFNLCPQPIDSWNEDLLRGSIFHTAEERERFARLLDWGLVDVYRRLRPEDASFSWWDYRAGAFHKNHGLRIDFVLATEPVAVTATAAEIDREYRKKKDGLIASDHAPVMVELAGSW
jgi:exodeoxyribonuclease-3